MVEQSSVKKKQTQGRGLHRWIASAAGLVLLAASVPAWAQAVEEMPSAADSAGVGAAVEEMPSAADSVGVSSNNSSGSGDAPSPEIEGGGWFSGVGFSFSGFSRIETAIRMTGEENPFNQRGNLFNGVPTARCGGVPPTPVCISPDVATRNGQKANNQFNLQQFRTHLDFQATFNENWSARALVRGIYELGEYDNFSRDAVGSNADGYLYGKPNFFEYDNYRKGGCQNRLEVCGRNYMVDLPNFTVDYQNGPLLIRAGNQQIAWGQALFFRVLDVPNGLDLRRHLFLDYTPEEYADERISSPAIRASYQINNEWEADSYVQMFQPTIYSNPNTPYNVIASQFTVHDRFNQVDDKLNYGLRLRGSVANVGLQFVYANRLNPDGVFRWTESGVNRGLPGALPNVVPGLTDTVSQLLGLALDPIGGGIPLTGAILARTPFEVDPTGVVSATEWFTYAGMARLSAVEGLNASITDFPATALLLANPVDSNEAAMRELDLFFQLSGGLRGHIERQYKRENNIGFGTSYVIEAEPGSLLDQLIVNFEAMYTPDRTFTAPSLGAGYDEREEWVTALVMEKYHRFSDAFPATYMVFQWEHRTESDLYGRLLDGMNGDSRNTAGGIGGKWNGWDGLVFAFQQPFPNLVYRVDAAVLYDTRGGLLAQLGLRWKPSGPLSAEVYYTYLNGGLGGNDNDNIISTIDYADELGIRLGYQF
ncbi:DUF1302 family protein [Hydrocarboniphaga sp.]|uniref:DUF1302 family protein n=1 Tax=Hydrocarboniphaga sp. TaxID=2033016 RepID=UPI002AB85779|nr:DUF1302 family protein [Hydrocarboniphaga sp.]MDZ4079012.1 DUF1302 family protein [Hydrocarboniphaga sp.]